MPRPDFRENETVMAEIIRVNHAGEFGAKVICRAQLQHIDNSAKPAIRKMLIQEQEHFNYFDKMLAVRKVRPTFLLPIWNLTGHGLGVISAVLGVKYAMSAIEAIEEVIENHYKQQLVALDNKPEEEELSTSIIGFMLDEVEHKETAAIYNKTGNLITSTINCVVKKICVIAINLSKKI